MSFLERPKEAARNARRRPLGNARSPGGPRTAAKSRSRYQMQGVLRGIRLKSPRLRPGQGSIPSADVSSKPATTSGPAHADSPVPKETGIDRPREISSPPGKGTRSKRHVCFFRPLFPRRGA
jgi:hypothetical protein